MKIVVLDDYQRVARAYAPFDSLPDIEVEVLYEHIADLAELAAALRGAQVVVAMRERTPFPAEAFAALPDLRLLVTTGMANASIDLTAAAAHGVTVSGTSSNTTELTWALILAARRHLVAEDRALRAGRWQTTVGTDLAGSGVVGAAELAAMKPTAVLVNTSRGPLVDQGALVEALATGAIAGAGLDVYDVEPLPPGNPLRTAPNTVLLPHLGYVTEGALRTMYRQVVENIAAWHAGTPQRVL
jgi:phosphoglycerate dehydrogenase-like enzyme